MVVFFKKFNTFILKIALIVITVILLVSGYIVFERIYLGSKQKVDHVATYKQLYTYFSGRSKPTTTLVLLTNNAEQRFGGGFIGSVFYIKSDKYGIKPSPIRSSYYYDHVIENQPTIGPVPLELQEGMLAKFVPLRDSANFANFPETAQAAATIFERESGVNVDNVVSFTPEMLKSLLAVTGSIRLDDYNMTVTADNFSQKVQLEVEGGQDKADNQDPKTILGELAAQILNRMMNRNFTQLSSLPKIITQMAKQKQLAVFSEDEQVENNLRDVGLAGNLNNFSGNYLMVANSNVGADKSSQFITQHVSQTLYFTTADQAEAEVIISRTHQLSAPAFPYYEPRKKIMMNLVGPLNYNYTKVFVPKGSKLLSSQTLHPVRVFDESDKTVFIFENSTQVGGSSEVHLRYQLPFRYAATDQVRIVSYYEQPIGGFKQDFSLSIVNPKDYRLQNPSPSQANFIYNTTINSDKRIEASYERAK